MSEHDTHTPAGGPGMSRRQFLERLACGALLAGAPPIVSSCGGPGVAGPAEPGAMTMGAGGTRGGPVSLLGYGCMRWPQASDGHLDQKAINRLVDQAIEGGINYFDTSPVYCQGESERATGTALARHPRDKWRIATKLSNFAPQLYPREESIAMYRHSFRELGVDHIDYYLLHAVGNGGPAAFAHRYLDNGVLDFLLEERAAGRIGNLGFSYHGDQAVFDQLVEQHGRYRWDFAMIQLNYIDWNHARLINERNTDASYLYEALHSRGIPAVIMEPLLGGRLVDLPDFLAQELRRRDPDKTPAQWAFQYIGAKPGILTMLSGMGNERHLTENLRTFSPLAPITDDDVAFLHHLADLYVDANVIPCNDCKYCMPCPHGLDIPGILLNHNAIVNCGALEAVDDAASSEHKKWRRRYLVGLGRAVEPARQPDKCTGCARCNPHCPQKIDIPAEMRKIDTLVEQLRRES